MPEITMATFNTHAAMDGWGRRYDLSEACKLMAADVIVLQEVFAPLSGVSQAGEVAADLDYSCEELPLARAWRRSVPIWHGKGWEPRKAWPSYGKSLRVGGRAGSLLSMQGYDEGTWGLAVLSRQPGLRTEVLELGRLHRDFTRRAALLVEIPVGTAGDSLIVVGTHAAHLSAGSPAHFRRLRRQLPPGRQPAALAGDMNVWGPPLSLLLPGWRRAAKGRTWPAQRPHSQIDHILVPASVEVRSGGVVRAGNSDHLPVRATLCW